MSMRVKRPTAKRRREISTISTRSIMLTITAVLLLLPCEIQTRGGLFIAAFHGSFIPRSRLVHQRGAGSRYPWLAESTISSKSSQRHRRVPFHHVCQYRRDQHPPFNPSQLASTAVDLPESSDSSSQSSVDELSSSEPTANAETVNGSVVPSSSTLLINNNVNGATNGATNTVDDANIPVWEMDPPPLQDEDVPQPTANGGFTHTKASKAKISAGNKGKTPWNKGKARSEETRARIAAGVRARNRERFLEKLQDMGLTEEEYETKKREERRIKDAERRARRTAKGGYRPTEETKQKISQILKQKWANGEMKKSPVHPDKVRRGFTHSPETRAKISESLKKRWADDPEYRKTMVEKYNASNSDEDVKKRISESLKKRWEDPEFRAMMVSKISTRRSPQNAFGQTHRERISAAMKAKWKDAEYRKKALDAMAKRREEMGIPTRKKKKKVEPGIRQTQPRAIKKKKIAKKKKRAVKKSHGVVVARKAMVAPKEKSKTKATSSRTSTTKRRKRVKGAKKKEPDGSITRLREERRDLYDLLYADEDDDSIDDGVNGIKTEFALGDEDLDAFDPYGLEDF